MEIINNYFLPFGLLLSHCRRSMNASLFGLILHQKSAGATIQATMGYSGFPTHLLVGSRDKVNTMNFYNQKQKHYEQKANKAETCNNNSR